MKQGGANSWSLFPLPHWKKILKVQFEKFQFSRISCKCATSGFFFFFLHLQCALFQKVGILNQIINIHTKESLTQVTYYSGPWCTSRVFIKLQPPTPIFQYRTSHPFQAQASGFSSSCQISTLPFLHWGNARIRMQDLSSACEKNKIK